MTARDYIAGLPHEGACVALSLLEQADMALGSGLPGGLEGAVSEFMAMGAQERSALISELQEANLTRQRAAALGGEFASEIAEVYEAMLAGADAAKIVEAAAALAGE